MPPRNPPASLGMRVECAHQTVGGPGEKRTRVDEANRLLHTFWMPCFPQTPGELPPGLSYRTSLLKIFLLSLLYFWKCSFCLCSTCFSAPTSKPFLPSPGIIPGCLDKMKKTHKMALQTSGKHLFTTCNQFQVALGGKGLTLLMNKPNWSLSSKSLLIIPPWNPANLCNLLTGDLYFAREQDGSACLN